METTVKVIPGVFSMVMSIVSLVILGVGIYLVFLLIKALRVYIKKNS